MPREIARSVCKFYNAPGGCSRGDNCLFTHCADRLAPSSVLCKNFVVATQDGCEFGNKCRFKHLQRENGITCAACHKRAFYGKCMDCSRTQESSYTFRRSTRHLRSTHAEEKSQLASAISEMNTILDSMQTSEAPNQTSSNDGTLPCCGICYDRKISHTLIPCGHCFCLVCIEASRGPFKISCPNCRDETNALQAIYL